MRTYLGSLVVVALLSVTPTGASAQETVDVLPDGARVRIVVPEMGVKPFFGEIAAVGGCQYVTAPFGRDTKMGIPLTKVMRLDVHASDAELPQPDGTGTEGDCASSLCRT